MADTAELVAVLRAAGETTRLRLLALLADGEQSVKDLTEILGQSQPRVSRHLKLLADAGIVSRNAEGAWAYYRIAESGVGSELARFMLDRLDQDASDRRGDRERLDKLRREQQAQAAAYFSKVAESWDLLRSLHVSEEAVEAAILAAIGDRGIGTLVDLGTGTGRMLELLAPRYQRGIGIDSSREMIAVARAKLAAASINHAQVRLADIGELEGAGLAADLIVLHQVLHYFDDPGRLLATARQVLRPRGEMLIVDFAPHGLEFLRTHHAHRRLGLSQSQMEGWARAADLTIADFQSLPPDTGGEGLTVCLWRLVDDAAISATHEDTRR